MNNKEQLEINKKEHPVAHRLATVIAVALGVILLVLLWSFTVIGIAGLSWLVLVGMLGFNITFKTVIGIVFISCMVGVMFGLFQW